ncbi:NHL repeat-containing protein [Streptomyces sp. NPDC060035]|uniref:NHL repeat-containing protein n=1 Tax=Streptomyces sp. NPDC060035 TaxID=3347044 RepID=UPI00369D9F82
MTELIVPISAGLPGGVVEIGLAYTPGETTPDKPHDWRTGSVALDGDVLVSVSYWSGSADIIRRGAPGAHKTVTGLVGPRGVSRCAEGHAVVAQPEIGRLTRIDRDGHIRGHLDLPGVSPWFACQWQDRWLVSDDTQKSVFLVSPDGRTVDRLPVPFPLRSVRSAVPVSADHYLLCDRESQSVVVVSLKGELVWQYGRSNYPSSQEGCLTSPEHAVALPFGVAIADTRNHRVLFVDWEGRVVWSLGGVGRAGSGPGRLWHPISVSVDGCGLLITDSGNDRVLEVDLHGRVVAAHGHAPMEAGTFHLPRSLEPTPAGYLVADSYNNRVTSFGVDGQGVRHTASAVGRDLFWPRNASVIDGSTVVSDSRNGRILLSDGHGADDWRELSLSLAGRPLALIDPHAVRKSRSGWLVTDTGLNAVLLFDPHTGDVLHAWCGEQAGTDLGRADVTRLPLDDVHDAVIDDEGAVWFANTGHDQIAVLPHRAPRLRVLAPRSASGASSPFVAPRSIDLMGNQLLVTDSGNHRIVRMTRAGLVTGVYGRRRGHAVDCLSDPRLARVSRSGEVISIADYLNDRVLLVPRTALGEDSDTVGSAAL